MVSDETRKTGHFLGFWIFEIWGNVRGGVSTDVSSGRKEGYYFTVEKFPPEVENVRARFEIPSQSPRPLASRVVENAGAVGNFLSGPAPSSLAPPFFLMVLACSGLTLPEPKVFVSCDAVNYGIQKKDRVLVVPQTSPTSLYPSPEILPDTAKLTVRAPSRRGLGGQTNPLKVSWHKVAHGWNLP